jgi:tRNA(fMet)-specific endonuclease VapC
VLDALSRNEGNIVLSALSLVELQRGLHLRPAEAALRRARTETLLSAIPILPFDQAAAMVYGDIIARCGWVRARDYDRMIAAHALSTSSILVTNNLTDFRDVPNLTTVDWTVRG